MSKTKYVVFGWKNDKLKKYSYPIKQFYRNLSFRFKWLALTLKWFLVITRQAEVISVFKVQIGSCYRCEKNKSGQHDDEGNFVCDDCYDSLCYICHLKEAEMEMSNGEYCCVDCGCGMADHYYDRMREEGY